MMRKWLAWLTVLPALMVSGCGYHTLGVATHIPAEARTLSVPVFATKTDAYRTEVEMSNAVVREFASRTRLRVVPGHRDDADLVLEGTILKEHTAPLTFNTSTQQSSSFLVTVVVSVRLVDRVGKVLYENPNYVFRQQYQSTTDLPTFLQENPGAVARLSRDFARALVADVIEGF